MSYNPIDKLTGIEKLRKLQVLFMGNCKAITTHTHTHTATEREPLASAWG
jgi:hypothetical protein